MITYVLVAVGGALGSVGRFWLGIAMIRLTGASFPWGTILINILGSFVIGWYGARYPVSNDARAFVMAGLCGGFTTFSAFSLQTAELLRAGEAGRAVANIFLSVGACLVATLVGLALGRQ
jgi:CrcB protein